MFDFDDQAAPSWNARQLLWLQQFPGIGSVRAVQVARAVPDPSQFADQWPAASGRLGKWAFSVPPIQVEEFQHFPHLTVIGLFDSDYPPILSTIPNPPAVLWLRGTLRPDLRNVAVVGTRHPTDFGLDIAVIAATHAVGRGLGVVSGLALGVDAIAHQASLDADGYTIAVLAGSLESPQPRQNHPLADRILGSGGALVCETLPDTEPSARSLVARNRIQSGLSVATVIAQSGIPGGTLHTARVTIEQGRQLIVPRPLDGQALEPASAGNVALTDADGIDPAVLKADRKTAEILTQRKPAADDAPENPAALKRSLDAL